MPSRTAPESVHLHTLPNGVRLLVLHQPSSATASASLFVRSGSAHEPQKLAGISHLVEHMVFKGSATRSCQQINLDAERLGAEVNAHTDRDHTAFHMRGLGEHAADFVRMLADIVLAPRFPADELERERAVVLQEYAEDEDDPVSAAYRLVDAASFAPHPAARPIIGTRRGIESITRQDLLGHVAHRYTGCNMLLAMAGPTPPHKLLPLVESAFGHLPAGQPNAMPTAAYQGGLRTKAMPGSSQSHLVMVLPLAARGADELAPVVAATLFGEGMSSPLLGELRERRGLVYYAACSADVLDMCGQFMVEASTSPEQLEETVRTVTALLARQAESIDPIDLERARNQLKVKRLRQNERPHRRLESLALDWMSLGRIRSAEDELARLEALDAESVRACFAAMLAGGATVAVSGRVARGLRQQLPGWMQIPLANPGQDGMASGEAFPPAQATRGQRWAWTASGPRVGWRGRRWARPLAKPPEVPPAAPPAIPPRSPPGGRLRIAPPRRCARPPPRRAPPPGSASPRRRWPPDPPRPLAGPADQG